MHTQPQLKSLLPTARSAARLRSASSSTINGSEPPNSNSDFLTYLEAIEDIDAPAKEEPVKEIPQTIGLEQI